MLMLTHKPTPPANREPWNKGKLIGPKPPFKRQEIWATRIRLEIEHCVRELAMFDLAIDSKLRGCDLVRLKVSDVMHGRHPFPAPLWCSTRRSSLFDLRSQSRREMPSKLGSTTRR